jgi:hypothetical protein
MCTLDKVVGRVVEEFNNSTLKPHAPRKPSPALEMPADGRITTA